MAKLQNSVDSFEQPETRADVVEELREMAQRGTTVRELSQTVQSRLGYNENAVLPVLWYFSKAFNLSLKDVLPIREWVGTDKDDEIDAIILPAIERTQASWKPVKGRRVPTPGG